MRFRQLVAQHAQKKWLQLYTPIATLPAHSVDCPECGLRVQLPKLRQGQEACCPRCHHQLVRVEYHAFQMPLACALAALILMILVYSQTFAVVILGGIYTHLSLPEMVLDLMVRDFNFLGSVLFLMTFGAPVLFLLLSVYVYASLLSNAPFPYLLYATRILTRLQQWIMIDVFFVSALVADIKMSSVSQVEFGAAFWLMPVLALLVLRTTLAVPIHWVYYQIHRSENHDLFHHHADEPRVCCTRCLYHRPVAENICGVCGSQLFHRRPNSLKISFCFLLAATLLYLPANFLPIMISADPSKKIVSTIMSGIILMWHDGDKMIAAIIFSASILVPSLKIVSMAILLYNAKFQPRWSVEKLSLQYRITEWVGRWSMIDIFVIIILMTAFHTPVAKVIPGAGALYFCLVVILTMLSAHFFDVRLIWDWKMKQNQWKK
ncbi:paraquat-inducible protein A [Alysiella filiformis]|uniref:Paraquat-inducible protein A n=1 Tax=Alysiella filiformis DSM 16848 TaxID=1120981 RepID=A0A286E219_9NEIS|nr:paraquat-inducible protein A [Alysiella filiformis]QMT30842.1 paraquat-inducible protein A [Alysiella filiformis]UBQ56176.1 paraquat-inducible protein A [Alysiella filiformis DSM 16848]SOD64947.1 paraquat-inducible protein A [Alysiella filiformis DSM 16848]